MSRDEFELLCSVQVVGRGVSRQCQWSRHSEVAASVGGPGPCQHHMHTGLPGVHVSHHSLQQPGRQDTGRSTSPAR
jgi:hypothetical protein